MSRVLWVFFALFVAVMEGDEAKLYLQMGHSSSVDSVAFSPDGRLALTGSRDNPARLWDLATGREIAALEGHSNFPTSVTFSPEPT